MFIGRRLCPHEVMINQHQINLARTDPLVSTYILLWGSIWEPFIMKMLGDEEYLWSYTKGFAELPSPAQVPTAI